MHIKLIAGGRGVWIIFEGGWLLSRIVVLIFLFSSWNKIHEKSLQKKIEITSSSLISHDKDNDWVRQILPQWPRLSQ